MEKFQKKACVGNAMHLMLKQTVRSKINDYYFKYGDKEFKYRDGQYFLMTNEAGANTAFGELALVYDNLQRNATVTIE